MAEASEDPELRRIAELLVGQREGRLDDAELEELALYVDEQPALVKQARGRLGQLVLPRQTHAPSQAPGHQDQAWLERVHGDHALARAHQTSWTRMERGLGLTLVFGGWGLALFGVAAGWMMTLVGVALLLGSFIRVRLANRDPYDRIEQ